MICCAKTDSENSAGGGGDNDPNNYNLEKELDPEEVARIHADAAKDDPKWASWVNMGAVLVIFVCSFFWGYFA